MAAPIPVPNFARTPTPFVAWVGVILLFVLFGLAVGVLIGLSPRGDNYEAKRAQARAEKWKTAHDDAMKDLHSYAWVDKDKGVARIPIERAMELTLAQLAQKKPAPANPIATPSPAAGVSPGASADSLATQTGAAQPSATPSAGPSASVTPKPTSIEGKNSENRGQPAAANNPPGAPPGTQPGPAATPAAAPSAPSGEPAVQPTGTPIKSSAGTPIPAAGVTPTPKP